MVMKFNFDDDLHLHKMLIVVRSAFYEGEKCYP